MIPFRWPRSSPADSSRMVGRGGASEGVALSEVRAGAGRLRCCRTNSRFSSSTTAMRSGSNRATWIPASRKRHSPRPSMFSFGSRIPMKTFEIRRSITRSTHGNLGWLREVQGSRVVKRTEPASLSSDSFLSSNVYSACSPGASSPRSASPITRPSRAITAPTIGDTLSGSLLHDRACEIALSMRSRSLSVSEAG